METKAFRYDFAMKELVYFLFKKKNCPMCNNKMEKSKDYEIVNGSTFNSKGSAFFIPNSKVKHYYYVYKCPNCGKQYTLKELANKWRLKIITNFNIDPLSCPICKTTMVYLKSEYF